MPIPAARAAWKSATPHTPAPAAVAAAPRPRKP